MTVANGNRLWHPGKQQSTRPGPNGDSKAAQVSAGALKKTAAVVGQVMGADLFARKCETLSKTPGRSPCLSTDILPSAPGEAAAVIPYLFTCWRNLGGKVKHIWHKVTGFCITIM